jgi:hypothetical protein
MKKLTAFVAHSFAKSDEKKIQPIFRYLESLQNVISVRTAEAPESGSVSAKVRRIIANSDILIAVFTKRHAVRRGRVMKPSGWTAPPWVHQEVGCATSARKPILAFREAGVEISGIVGDLEYIPYDWRNPATAFIRANAIILSIVAGGPYEVTLLASRAATYKACARVMSECRDRESEHRVLLHAALHGYVGKRKPDNPPFAIFKAFDREFFKIMALRGEHAWKVKEIYNITTPFRLKMLLEYLNDPRTKAAENYQMRACVLPNTLPEFSLLIVGSKDVFLGVDDPTYYRVERAIHLHSREYVDFVTSYFQALWYHPEMLELKSTAQIEKQTVLAIRSRLRSRTRKG